jgi:hypothetical protein
MAGQILDGKLAPLTGARAADLDIKTGELHSLKAGWTVVKRGDVDFDEQRAAKLYGQGYAQVRDPQGKLHSTYLHDEVGGNRQRAACLKGSDCVHIRKVIPNHLPCIDCRCYVAPCYYEKGIEDSLGGFNKPECVAGGCTACTAKDVGSGCTVHEACLRNDPTTDPVCDEHLNDPVVEMSEIA